MWQGFDRTERKRAKSALEQYSSKQGVSSGRKPEWISFLKTALRRLPSPALAKPHQTASFAYRQIEYSRVLYMMQLVKNTILYDSIGFTEHIEECQKLEEEEEEMAVVELPSAVALADRVSNYETSTVPEGSLI